MTEARLSWIGWLVAVGLAVEIVVSGWAHPLSFVIFAVVACPLVVGAMLLFFWSLVSAR